MPLARIVHWRPTESGPLIEACRSSGWKIDYPADPTGPTVTRGLRENIPEAVVIDLSRLPSHGREIAVWMRNTKWSRHIPIVFANGDPAKVDAIRQLLPDALYATTGEIATVLTSLSGVETPVQISDPVVPPSMMDRYAAKSIAEKLGIGPGSTVAVMDPPRKYATVVGPLSEGVDLIENPRAVKQVTLWFVRDMDGLSFTLRRMHAMADKTRLWLIWKKGLRNNMSQNGIREAAIAAGLVDYKICALDEGWSGILFTRRKSRKRG